MFSTAGRTVKSGLVASAVVSSWTWAATLLQSSSVAYRYGVSGPFWYASGATVQIILFASIAIELKRRAPNAHVSWSCLRSKSISLSEPLITPLHNQQNLVQLVLNKNKCWREYCLDLSRGYQGSVRKKHLCSNIYNLTEQIRHDDPSSIYSVWTDDQHFGHSYAFDRRERGI